MSHDYEIISAKYDASMGADNPSLIVIGTVDGIQYPFAATYHQVQSANSVGGSSAVQLLLAPLMLNTMIINRQIPAEVQQQIPVSYGAVPDPLPAGANNGWVSVSEALVGSWTA